MIEFVPRLMYCIIPASIYNDLMVNLARGVDNVGSRTGEVQVLTDDGCRLAACRGRGRRRRRASQNRDVMPGAWLTGADGRVQVIPLQSGVTACVV